MSSRKQIIISLGGRYRQVSLYFERNTRPLKFSWRLFIMHFNLVKLSEVFEIFIDASLFVSCLLTTASFLGVSTLCFSIPDISPFDSFADCSAGQIVTMNTSWSESLFKKFYSQLTGYLIRKYLDGSFANLQMGPIYSASYHQPNRLIIIELIRIWLVI